jgi:hypothetical protein
MADTMTARRRMATKLPQEQAGPKRNASGSGMETLFLKPTF